MKNQKISFLSVFSPYRGGIAQFNDLLSEELEDFFELQKFNFKTQYPKVLFPGKSQFIEGVEGIDDAVFSTINPLAIQKQLNLIKASDPAVFLTAYWMPFFAPSLGWIAKKIPANVLKIAILHNVVPHEEKTYDQILNKYFLKQFDAFITLSETVSQQLTAIIPNAKYKQLFHPVYNQFGEAMDQATAFDHLNLPKDKKIVLFFGFIRKYKGLDLLIEAIAPFKEEVHLVIAGESYEDFNKYKTLLQSNNFSSNHYSHFDGYISDDKVRALFSAANLLALPYKKATQSGIAAIAKSFNLPMLITPVGELPKELRHQKTGWLCDAVTVKAIRDGIKNTIAQEDFFRANLRSENNDLSFKVFSQQMTNFIQECKK